MHTDLDNGDEFRGGEDAPMGVIIELPPATARLLEEAKEICVELQRGLDSASSRAPEMAGDAQGALRAAQYTARGLAKAWEQLRPFIADGEGDPAAGVVFSPLEVSTGGPIRIIKADEEKRYVVGVVLEPGVIDAQSDVYSAETVEKAAFLFMEDYQNLGRQHEDIVNGKLKIRTSWVALEDTVIGGQPVWKGSWLLGVHVIDDSLWAAVKAGQYTGFSIGGHAQRKPV